MAAPKTLTSTAVAVATDLERAGHTVTRDWWNYEAGGKYTKKRQRLAQADLDAIKNSDIVLCLTVPRPHLAANRIGMFVEQGIGLALEKEVWMVHAGRTNEPAPYRSIFDNLCLTLSLEEAYAELGVD